jgi:transposase
MRLRHSRFTHNQTNRLIERFVAGTPARTAVALIGVNKDIAATFYHRLRIVIAENLMAEAGELAASPPPPAPGALAHTPMTP